MSIANLSVTIGTRQYKSADGSKRERSAAEKFRYIARYDRHEVRDDLRHTSSGNLPYWTHGDAEKFWAAADKHERKNGTLYVEHLLRLPRDLTLKQHIELVENWAAEEASNRAYTYAIHYSKAEDGGLNPHCHFMLNESLQDGIKRSESKYFKRYNAKNPEKGGCKKGGTGSRTPAQNKQELLRQRQRFEDLCNDALEQADKTARVSLQSYKTRGIDEVPEPKLGYAGWRDEAAKNGVLAMREVKRELDKKLKNIEKKQAASLKTYNELNKQIEQERKENESRLRAEIEISEQRATEAREQLEQQQQQLAAAREHKERDAERLQAATAIATAIATRVAASRKSATATATRASAIKRTYQSITQRAKSIYSSFSNSLNSLLTRAKQSAHRPAKPATGAAAAFAAHIKKMQAAEPLPLDLVALLDAHIKQQANRIDFNYYDSEPLDFLRDLIDAAGLEQPTDADLLIHIDQHTDALNALVDRAEQALDIERPK